MDNIYKLHELTLDVSAKSRTNVVTNTTFFSMDVKTARKMINFTVDGEPLDLSEASVMLAFDFVGVDKSKVFESKDGSVVVEDALAGRCSVVLPNHVYDYAGEVLVHVYVMFEDGRSLDCGVIVTEFEESWLDSERAEMANFYVQRFEDLAQELETRAKGIREDMEALRSDVDQTRVQIEANDLVTSNEFEKHTADGGVHINQDERKRWNDTVSQDVFDKHTANAEAHISLDERARWNDAIDSTTFASHAKDEKTHVTNGERNRWEQGIEHANDGAQHVTILEVNQFSTSAPATKYPKGDSVQVVNSSLAEDRFPATAGVLRTSRASDFTTVQQFWETTTSSEDPRIWYRNWRQDRETGSGWSMWRSNVRNALRVNSNADFNAPEFRVEGRYFNSTNATTATIRNRPSALTQAFSMSVYRTGTSGGTGCHQVIRQHSNNRTFIRNMTNLDVWSEWREYSTIAAPMQLSANFGSLEVSADSLMGFLIEDMSDAEKMKLAEYIKSKPNSAESDEVEQEGDVENVYV